MSDAQNRAVHSYRARLTERGLRRFEVVGLDDDRDLIRSLARRLAADDPEATDLRASLRKSISGEPPRTGGILAALRRSPLVGLELDLTRSTDDGRSVTF